jgi:hypothetical protein
MLIFDRFPSREVAEQFAQTVEKRSQRKTEIWESQEAMQAECLRWLAGDKSTRMADVFPWVLDPPIVLIERDAEYSREREIEVSVKPFGGTFAGT